jgi:dipeptide transport system ATP-binding protein
MMKPKATVKALDGASFQLFAGKTLAVVGESGCGKSTLARLLTLIEEPTAGELTIDGLDIKAFSKSDLKSMRQKVQMIFQNPYGSLNPRKKIGTILEEPLVINTNLSAGERREKSMQILEKVGLRTEHYHRFPHMFSGGQRQRIAIARALMLNPKVVVADEPVSALDVSVQAQVLNLMKDLQKDFGLAYVFISHGLSVVEHIADDVMVMYLGKTVEKGSRDKIFNSPAHPYTQALLSSTPFVDPTRRAERVKLKGELPSPLNPPTGCPFHQRCPIAVADCSKSFPQTIELAGRMVACHRAEDSITKTQA